ncbi:hypothetical protein [Nocardia otitidiscaviarum]|uniref:hypothetical protein n=1 Tax=Nocardia otitidiscaviarum TaxID=1823 RepID=UPI0018963420|nr:hypothetical protein [Nocardia otitidiscaviarum]MBF6183081.1 hypothetical protein [Nocardia otitidiscaviarum]
MELLPTVDAAGRQLTLSPVGAAATPLRDISAQDTFWAEFEKAKAAGIAGLVIGGGQPLIDAAVAYASGQP